MALNSGKNMPKKITVALFSLVILFFIIPLASAKEDPITFIPQIGIPGLVEKGQQITLTKNDTSYLALMVKGFYNYGLGIAGILAAIVLMAGGIIWLTSAGSSDKISQAKGLITGSITGLLLVFGSWIILKTINPNLVDFRAKSITPITQLNLTTCCQYTDKEGVVITREGLPQDECSKLNGNFTQNGKAVVRANGDKKCASSGCCLCKIGGGWDTLWTNVENSCTDKAELNGVDMNESFCSVLCETKAKYYSAVRNLKGVMPDWEYSFKWDNSCNDDGECVQNQGGGGSEW